MFEKMMLLIYWESDILHGKKKKFLLGFTFWTMEQMVDFANEFEQYCKKEDFLDYRNILVLLFVINAVFHRTLEQDHWLWVQELIKRKSSKIWLKLCRKQSPGDIPTHCSMTGPWSLLYSCWTLNGRSLFICNWEMSLSHVKEFHLACLAGLCK